MKRIIYLYKGSNTEEKHVITRDQESVTKNT